MKPGGTEGGTPEFIGGAGMVLAGLALYFLFDSVHVGTGGAGLFTHHVMGGSYGGVSMGVIFVPFLLGVIMLFYNGASRLGNWLLWLGLAIIVIEILSRVRFVFDMKTSHLLLILGLFGAGVGLMLRAFRQAPHLGEGGNSSAKDSLSDDSGKR
jgi:uncharacterized protein